MDFGTCFLDTMASGFGERSKRGKPKYVAISKLEGAKKRLTKCFLLEIRICFHVSSVQRSNGDTLCIYLLRMKT